MQDEILCDSCRLFGTCHRSDGYAINCALYRPFEKPPKLRVYCRPTPSCTDCVDFLGCQEGCREHACADFRPSEEYKVKSYEALCQKIENLEDRIERLERLVIGDRKKLEPVPENIRIGWYARLLTGEKVSIRSIKLDKDKKRLFRIKKEDGSMEMHGTEDFSPELIPLPDWMHKGAKVIVPGDRKAIISSVSVNRYSYSIICRLEKNGRCYWLKPLDLSPAHEKDTE